MLEYSGTFIAGSVGCPFEVNGTSGLATVLLVDDDPNILRPLKLLVEREGYRVVTALDGRAALAAAAIESPGLIVTDWMMPHVDGVELCRRLKGDPATADIPVVMLSAAFPPTPNEPLWDVLLRKPAPIGHLIRAIHSLLDGQRPEPPGR
ncbi:response regulator [Paraburkholderia domus]|jgi:Response regulators consisting of a CheY-like receiver domain and a winged-helix DNA-binding domain|uniref:response regulator n=1 Tax=Paraburkholderia domus TaxID=2793075 RepID=UPI0019141385|nr:response regulator [Paraburkholderia domus]MBK5051231.1 response regulator [Burkholderia sp. R-70006]MBK5121068.1 response regulator [Burkholderia sp. R-69980]MBK5166399.1 response regulator [Burkholderia sp. R-70211]MBK5184993.1 response regulator [Burkholderia sp. R-69749]MCI0146553.1 response regulator [Paraburkholderia sediminicola]